MLIDTHAHISYFEESQQIPVINRAIESGVRLILNISTEVEKFALVVSSAHNFKEVFFSVGTHPCHVQDEPHIEKQHLVDIVNNNNKVIAIGETGLDYYHSTQHIELQREKFQNHIEAASQFNIPLIVHTRNAEDDTLFMLTKAKKQYPDLKIVIHCFTGGVDFCQKLLAIGCYISYSGIVTFKNAKDAQESLSITPLNRILIETDSPFLAPNPHRGKKNEPSFVQYVANFVAQAKSLDTESLQKIVFENFASIFPIPDAFAKV